MENKRKNESRKEDEKEIRKNIGMNEKEIKIMIKSILVFDMKINHK